VPPVATPVVTPPPVATPVVTPPAVETPATPSETPAVEPSGSPAVEPSGSPAVEPSGSPAVEPSGSPGAAVDPYAALFGSTYAPATGTPGGQIVFGEWQPASQLNPYFTTAFTNFEALGPVLAGLTNIDAQGKFYPDLAADIPTPKNGDLVIDTPKGGFTMTIKLKPGLEWSDGQPLTLKDFAFTYEWAAKVGLANIGCSGCPVMVPLIDGTIADPAKLWAAGNRYIKTITVADDGLSMVVVWNKNYAGWLGWMSNAILPEHYFTALPIDTTLTSSMPVGPGIEKVPWSGPFMITAASSDGIDYARNDHWNVTTHKAYLDTMRFKFYGSKDGMITDFLSGAIDLAFDMTQADFPQIQGVAPDVGQAKLDTVWQYEHFDLNTSHANVGLNDPLVRKAIAMAVDKQGMIDVLFPGAGVSPACSPAPPGTWWRTETECPAYDVAGANALLDQAGWTVNPDSGLREKDVDKDSKTPADVLNLRLCTTSGNPTRLTELSRLSGDLGAVGITSDVQTGDAASVVFAGWADTTKDTVCSIYRGTYDIADFAYILGGDLYSNYYFTYASTQIPSDKNPNGSNDTRFNDKDMDAALNTLSNAVDPVDQFAAAVTVQTAYSAGIPEIPIYYRAETTGLGNHVGNWPGYNPSSAGPTWNTGDWFVNP